MKFRTSLVAALLMGALGVSTAQAVTLYWDRNGSTDGGNRGNNPDPGDTSCNGNNTACTFGDGTWDTTHLNWNQDPLGGSATGGVTTWVAGSDAVFSAGSDNQGGEPAFADVYLTINPSPQVAASVLIEEGSVQIVSGNIDTSAATGPLTINPNAKLSIPTTGTLPGNGTVILNGGTLDQRNTGNAGSFIGGGTGLKPIQITANGGTVKYNSLPEGQLSSSASGVTLTTTIFSGTISGPGRLTKTGTGEFRVQSAASTSNSYNGLTVNQGMFRVGSSGLTAANADAALGALPGVTDPTYLTLDGGQMGYSLSFTMNAKRGVFIGSNGGAFSSGGGVYTGNTGNQPSYGNATLTVDGPVSGAGQLEIRGVSAGHNSNTVDWGITGGGVVFNNATSTFTGKLLVSSSLLRIAQNFSAGSLSGGVNITVPVQNGVNGATITSAATSDVATIGRIDIDAGKTLTVGADNSDSSFAGRIGGTGTFIKTGNGTLTVNTGKAVSAFSASGLANFSGRWLNTEGVMINGGTLRYAAPPVHATQDQTLVSFADTVPVTVATGATWDMNSINDVVGSISGGGTISRGTATLQLSQTAGTARTFSGQVTGGGAFTKDNAWSQTLNQGAANNTFGAVTVNGGSLILNGGNTATSTNVAGGTLGGSGSITNAITVASGAHVAPGGATGDTTDDFGGGSVTFNSGSFLDIELGGTAFGSYDQFALSAASVINGGTLSLTTLGGYTPTVGDTFHVLHTNGIGLSGAGFTLDATAAATAPNSAWQLLPSATSVIVSLVGTAPPIFAGDYNDDGVVDSRDYVLWRKQLPSGGHLFNDPTAGADGADYGIWVANYGNSEVGSGGGGNGAAPEPTSCVMLLLGLAGLASRRRGR